MSSSVKYGLQNRRPVAYVSSASVPNLDKIVKAISFEWNFIKPTLNSFLFVNLISDERTFSSCTSDIYRRKKENLKCSIKNLIETDLRPVIFTSGRSDDPVSVAAGHAALETFENAVYSSEFYENASAELFEKPESFEKSLKFKLIAVNSIQLIEDGCSQLEDNHTHLIIIEDKNVTESELLTFRIELMKCFSNGTLFVILFFVLFNFYQAS